MRILLSLLFALLFFSTVAAQDTPSPEAIALEQIQWAQENRFGVLNLSDIGLSELPPELWELTQLRELTISHDPRGVYHHASLPNHLEVLPAEIGLLDNLLVLDLSHNQLTTLPPEIGHLKNLRVLLLADNQLTALPAEIGQLEHLCILDVSGNQLRELPHELSQLRHLADDLICNGLYRAGIVLFDNPLISPPEEVIIQGSPAILDYLSHQASWHFRKLIVSGASGFGLFSLCLLGMRWQGLRGKRKRKSSH